MAEEFLKINQRIQIEVKEGPFAGKYYSRIEDVGVNELVIGAPIYRGEIIKLKVGSFINIVLTGENALFQFESKILEEITDPLPLLVISKPKNMQKVQRRNFFRIKVTIPVEYRVLPDILETSTEEFKFAETVDISGGGTLLLISEEFPKETILELKLHLKENLIVPAVGRVVFTKDEKRKDKKKMVAVEFIVIEEREREKIVKFVFEKQREERQKALRDLW
jgi:c-di-GMP-binding flagellar brake protein YcgR